MYCQTSLDVVLRCVKFATCQGIGFAFTDSRRPQHPPGVFGAFDFRLLIDVSHIGGVILLTL